MAPPTPPSQVPAPTTATDKPAESESLITTRNKVPAPTTATDKPAEPESLTTTRNIIIAVFVLGAVAGQVLVARRNTQTLKTIAKRTGVKFEKPPKSKNDDDWF